MDKLVITLNAEKPREITNQRIIKVILFLLEKAEWFGEHDWGFSISFGSGEDFKWERTQKGSSKAKPITQ